MKLKPMSYRPTGSWWNRLIDACSLALENRLLRAGETRQIELWDQFIDLDIR